ncbi:MAG: hypothetical protein U0Q22_03965 [Acidimicrobiales bacterium]
MTNASSVLTPHIDAIAAYLAALAPGEVALDEVVDVFEQFVRIERLGAAGRVMLLQRVARSGVADQAGTSAAEWAAARAGRAVGTTRHEMDTSGRLEECPDTADALRRGEVSAEQAGIIADAAVVNPDAEAGLLDRAKRESFKNLKDEAAREKARAIPDPEEQQRQIHRKRYCRTFRDAEGAMNLVARGTGASISGFAAELERLTDATFKSAWANGRREPREAYRYDALMELAERSANADRPHPDGPHGAESEGERPGVGRPGGGRQGRGRGRGRNVSHLALIRVDFAALVAGTVAGDEVCEIPGIGPVSVAQCRALLGDAALKLILTKGSDVGGVVHFGRGANALQKLALLWSQPVCQAEGCDRTILQTDHRTPWAQVRETATPNLDHLCGPDNRKKSIEGWELVAGSGRRPFVPPTDPRHPRHRPAQLFQDTG